MRNLTQTQKNELLEYYEKAIEVLGRESEERRTDYSDFAETIKKAVSIYKEGVTTSNDTARFILDIDKLNSFQFESRYVQAKLNVVYANIEISYDTLTTLISAKDTEGEWQELETTYD